jgi:hypothetical protein
LNDQVVVDSWDSVDTGRRYDTHKGDHVRVTYNNTGSRSVPVFIRAHT